MLIHSKTSPMARSPVSTLDVPSSKITQNTVEERSSVGTRRIAEAMDMTPMVATFLPAWVRRMNYNCVMTYRPKWI